MTTKPAVKASLARKGSRLVMVYPYLLTALATCSDGAIPVASAWQACGARYRTRGTRFARFLRFIKPYIAGLIFALNDPKRVLVLALIIRNYFIVVVLILL